MNLKRNKKITKLVRNIHKTPGTVGEQSGIATYDSHNDLQLQQNERTEQKKKLEKNMKLTGTSEKRTYTLYPSISERKIKQNSELLHEIFVRIERKTKKK